ncbi:hypothetical protein B0H19DRAFT_935612, partial [Mycena capillaripes]
MSLNTVIVDDTDPSITYSGGWNNAGAFIEFNGTTKWASVEGSTATFTFVGTAIIYYGGLTTTDNGAAIASIVLDGGAPVSYTSPNPIPSITNNIIFNSGPIPAGSHTLVVTSTSEHTLWMDYFLVTPSP